LLHAAALQSTVDQMVELILAPYYGSYDAEVSMLSSDITRPMTSFAIHTSSFQIVAAKFGLSWNITQTEYSQPKVNNLKAICPQRCSVPLSQTTV